MLGMTVPYLGNARLRLILFSYLVSIAHCLLLLSVLYSKNVAFFLG